MSLTSFLLLLGATLCQGDRSETLFDSDWTFHRGSCPIKSPNQCQSGSSTAGFPEDIGDAKCVGLKHQDSPQDEVACAAACCADNTCTTWQFCPTQAACPEKGCWIGNPSDPQSCATAPGWVSRARPSPSTQISSACANVSFDDSKWRAVNVPHDWSAEDLPPREDDTEFPVVGVRYGDWKINIGDNLSWAAVGFDDRSWKPAHGGDDWRTYGPQFQTKNLTAWYRQEFKVAASIADSDSLNSVVLSLGVVAGSDETYLNGVLIGHVGDIHNPVSGDYITLRSYVIPDGLLVAAANGTNVIAVRVKSLNGAGEGATTGNGSFPGGLFDDPVQPMTEARVGPFDPAVSPGGKSTGYTLGGLGWYRKTFQNTAKPGQLTFIQFDGVYMNADTFVNGVHVGNHPYGYTTFEYDITPLLKAGSNVIAVRVNNGGKNSRWYSGSGIYRHTHLKHVDPVHVPTWGLWVTTPHVQMSSPGKATQATVVVQAQVHNSRSNPVTVQVSATIGAKTFTSAIDNVMVKVGGNTTVNATLTFTISGDDQLWLWSPDTPTVYTANVSVSSGGDLDMTSSTFGVRTVFVSSTTGLLLNGVQTKMYGGCVHHANGLLGSRTIDRAEERRVETLKSLGYNAIRTSHNPVSPAFLDACDRLGVLVMEETFDCWAQGKNPDDYHNFFYDWWQRDTAAMVLRDRNHPSIVMWSIGNEIPMRFTKQGANLSIELRDYVHSLDPNSGREVTSAYPMLNEQDSPFLHNLDVAGYNYAGTGIYEKDHERLPNRTMVGTESFPSRSFEMWNETWSLEWVLGDFIWTAMDYLGETAIGSSSSTGDVASKISDFPWHVSFCGDVDIVGHVKPQSLYRTVLWGVTPMTMLVHTPSIYPEKVSGWGWPDEVAYWNFEGHEGEPLQVRVFARGCNSTQISLNGKVLADVPFQANFTAVAYIPYAAGDLKAICVNGSTVIGAISSVLTTAETPASLQLDPDRSEIAHDSNDLSYVTVRIIDAEGVVVPNLPLNVTVEVSGPGTLVAYGTGNPADPASFQASTRTSWRGQLVAIVQPDTTKNSGDITVTVKSGMLKSATTIITTTKTSAV